MRRRSGKFISSFAAYGYARLSVVETLDRKDSQALSNQMELLRGSAAQKPALKLRGLYADSGETAASF